MAEDRMLNDEILLGLIKSNSGGGGGGTDDYNDLSNKPQIAGTTLQGNKTLSELGIASASALANKVDKVEGKGLSTNDYSDTEKAQVATNANDISTLKSGFTALDNEVNGDAVTYPYADVITIPDAVPANLADCSVKVEPVQDLHGYDKPWVGGAGKNKLPMTVDSIKTLNTTGTWSSNAYTVNNVTFTILTDNNNNVIGVNVNGTAGANVGFKLFQTDSVSAYDGMLLNGCPNDGSLSKYRIAAAGYNSGTFVKDYNNLGSDVELTLTEDNVDSFYVSITAFQGFNIQNIKFYPMLRLSTESDAAFAPYTNICPISGHTEAVVTVADDDTDPTVTNTYTLALGDTIYGGTVDFDSGVMTVTHGFADLGNFTYTKQTSENGTLFYTGFNAVNNAKYGNIDYVGTSLCSCFEYASAKTVSSHNKETINVGYDTSTRLRVCTDAFATLSESDFKTAVTGQKLCYELATPTTIQLTPQQIQLLKGQNTLTASTGDISVTVNGVSGSIGAVQGQVNELTEDVAEIKPVDYSTTEQATGRKWLNDPTYIVVIDMGEEKTVTSNTWYTVGNHLGTETIVNGMGITGSGGTVPLQIVEDTNDGIKILQTRNAQVGVRYVWLEYTKTT